jgi:hypothetical protein
VAEDIPGYITDAPINEPPEDRFSRAPFAQRIARTIAAQRDPASLVVGIYGPWGDGKTSVLNLIEHELATVEDMVAVRFNPWRLGDETEMFIGFFETLAEALDAKLATGKEKLGKLLRDYGGILTPVPFGGTVLGEAAQAAGSALSESSLDKARTRIEAILADSGKRVVILMDDLDRLDKSEIQAIFRLVKVAADFQHTAYILAFDESVVADALADRYASGTSHGTSFMEKIIQLPLHLPPVPPALLRQVTLETVEVALHQAGVELTQSEVAGFLSTFERAVVPRIKTPRVGKRYGNAALFALPMVGDEVNAVDLLLIEAIRIFFPRLYVWIRSHEQEVLEAHPASQAEAVHSSIRAALADGTAALSTEDVAGAQLLLTTLFPRTESAWRNIQWGGDWDSTWAKQKRIASRQYFRRYFTYTVAAGDVRDSDIEGLMRIVRDPSVDGGEVADVATALFRSGGPETFIQKVALYADEAEPVVAARLALLLTTFSDVLPDVGGFIALSTLERAALLTRRLIERVPQEERLGLTVEIMRSAQHIPFAVEVLRWVRPGDDAESSVLTTEEDIEVGRVLAERIASLWESSDPFAVLRSGAARTLHVWGIYGDLAALRDRLAAMVKADMTILFQLLSAFLGRSWSMETGVPLTSEFRRETYDAVTKYLDPAIVYELLRERYGQSVGTGSFYDFHDRPPEERLANEFAFIHRAVLEEQKMTVTAASQEAPDTSGGTVGSGDEESGSESPVLESGADASDSGA